MLVNILVRISWIVISISHVGYFTVLVSQWSKQQEKVVRIEHVVASASERFDIYPLFPSIEQEESELKTATISELSK